MHWPLLSAVLSEVEDRRATLKSEVRKEAAEHHMTAGNIVSSCVSSDNIWSDLQPHYR